MTRRDIRNALMAVALAAATVSCGRSLTVAVHNPLPYARHGEMVEIDASAVRAALGDSVVVSAPDGREVPWQATSDGLFIFPADVDGSATVRYKLRRGTPSPVAARVYGRKFPEHKDNMNWENDLSAYVAYGPALQQAGERGFGYDIWTKSVDTLVIEQRNRDRDRGISLHRDHGNGMDAYIVANTLGAGTMALLDADGEIIFPWAWRDYQITDCGPLRFRVRLTYNPLVCGGDSSVVETRVITLDAGTNLNRTEVTYSGLSRPTEAAAGIVVHRQNPYAYSSDPALGIIAYADSTDHPERNNGVVYVGAIVPAGNVSTYYKPVTEPARDALGHIMARTVVRPDEATVYYWGSAWSKNPTGPQNPDQWNATLRRYARSLAAPLQATVE